MPPLIRRIAVTVAKTAALVFVAGMALLQVPELTYDLGPKQPLAVRSPVDLEAAGAGTVFADVAGTIDADHAFVHRTHGLAWSYFLLDEYGTRLVVRSPEPLAGREEEWSRVRRHLGRLKPYAGMPFRRSVAATFREQFGVEIPADAHFLARDDVPAAGGWQVGAAVLAATVWGVLVWLFFLRRRAS
jgi:hypothetical protein